MDTLTLMTADTVLMTLGTFAAISLFLTVLFVGQRRRGLALVWLVAFIAVSTVHWRVVVYLVEHAVGRQ